MIVTVQFVDGGTSLCVARCVRVDERFGQVVLRAISICDVGAEAEAAAVWFDREPTCEECLHLLAERVRS